LANAGRNHHFSVAVALLGHASVPSLIDQIKIWASYGWSREIAPRFYRGPDDIPEDQVDWHAGSPMSSA